MIELAPRCYGCSLGITDRYLLQVYPSMEFHLECLRVSVLFGVGVDLLPPPMARLSPPSW